VFTFLTFVNRNDGMKVQPKTRMSTRQ